MLSPNVPLPSNLPVIPGLNDAAATAPPAATPPATTARILQKIQGPLDTLNSFIDQWLSVHHLKNPVLLGAIHLTVVVGMTLLLAWVAGAVCRSLGRYLGRHNHKLPSKLLLILAPVVRWVMVLAGLSDAIEDAWPAITGPVRWLGGGLFVIAVVLAVRGLIAVARTFLDAVLKPRLVETAAEDSGSDSNPSLGGVGSRALVPLIQRLAGVLLWLAGLILVLDHFGQNVSSVVAALGVTSLAIGLASQQALSNIIAGLVLAMDRPFRIGDRVRLPGLDGGEVLDIGMRATQIRLSDGSLLIVPNADLVSARLVNQSVQHAVRAEVRMTIPVSLDVDVLTRYLIEATGKTDPPPLGDRPPRVHLMAIGDKLDIALILWLPRHADAPRVEEQLRRVALRHIQARLSEMAAAATAAAAAAAVAARDLSGRYRLPPGPAPAPAESSPSETQSEPNDPTGTPPSDNSEGKPAQNQALLPVLISAAKLPSDTSGPNTDKGKRRR